MSAMVQLCGAILLIAIPSFALAQPLVQNVPPPGTIEPIEPVKSLADGPPRPLIRTDVPERPAAILIAGPALEQR